MQDLTNFTIPPELFYSKTSNEPKKRKILALIPSAIKKKVKTISTKTVRISKSFKRGNNRKLEITKRPQLGSINKNYLKKLKKKKKQQEKQKRQSFRSENTTPNRSFANLSTVTVMSTISNETVQENDKILKDISNKNSPIIIPPKPKRILIVEDEDQEERFAQSKMFVAEDPKPTRKKSGSFKFFKSKNDRSEEEYLSDHDLFADEFDRSEPESPKHKIIEPENFEDDADEKFVEEKQNIESLLSELDGDTNDDFPKNPIIPQEPQSTSLQNVIDILESSELLAEKTEEQSQTVAEKARIKDSKEKDSIKELTKSDENNPNDTTKEIPDNHKTSAKVKDKPLVKFLGLGKNQLQIDAGQKKFGITECKDCGFNYNTNVPEDELIHEKHHESLMKIPRFRGWATEESYTITGINKEDTRVIYLEPNNKNMTSSFVTDLIGNMTSELGVPLNNHEKYHLYICVVAEKMVGLCAVEESVSAVLRNSDDSTKAEVRLGVQRLYVRSNSRRKGIAKSLLKTISLKHFKGELLNISSDVAFSSPTEDGIKFLKNLLNTEHFYVY